MSRVHRRPLNRSRISLFDTMVILTIIGAITLVVWTATQGLDHPKQPTGKVFLVMLLSPRGVVEEVWEIEGGDPTIVEENGTFFVKDFGYRHRTIAAPQGWALIIKEKKNIGPEVTELSFDE